MMRQKPHRPLSRCASLIGICLLLAATPATSRAVGLLVAKGTNASPEFAIVIPFGKCERFAVSYKVDTLNRGQQILQANEVFDLVEYDPSILRYDYVQDQDFAIVETVVSKAAALAQRFPAMRKEVPAFLQPLQSILSLRAQGMVQFRGSRMSLADCQQILKREKEQMEEQQRKREAELRDRSQRDRNLKARLATLPGRALLKDYPAFLQMLEKSAPGDSAGLRLPATAGASSLPLPRFKKLDIALEEGRSLDAPAVLRAGDETGCLALRLAVGLRMDGDSVTNADDLRAVQSTLARVTPELGDWLPLGVVSARTRLEFQRGKPGAGPRATIEREFGGHPCELTLTEPTTHDDGSLHAILSVTVR